MFRIAGGIFIILLGVSYLGVYTAPSAVLGVIGVIAGVALLAGI